MKAAYLVGVSQFQVTEVPDPALPDDGVLIKVKSCGVCGSDLRRWHEGPYPGSEQLISGHEIAGEVLMAGGQVTDIRVGDRLAVAPDIHCGKCYFCERGLFNLCDNLRLIGITPGYQGGLAEKMVLTGEMLVKGIVHRIPKGLDFTGAALAEPCSSVLAAHAKANTGLKDTVLVMGAGPIGCLHIAVAKARGAKVILSEPSGSRREMAIAFAPDMIIDPVNQDVIATAKQDTGGRGVDIAICANPVAATQTLAVEAVRKAGKVILFGGLPKAAPMTSLDGNRIHYGEIEVVGAFSYHPIFHEQALEVIQRKLIPQDKLISHTFPLENVNEAFNMAASGLALKVMVAC